jgi:hypothetical protein
MRIFLTVTSPGILVAFSRLKVILLGRLACLSFMGRGSAVCGCALASWLHSSHAR